MRTQDVTSGEHYLHRHSDGAPPARVRAERVEIVYFSGRINSPNNPPELLPGKQPGATGRRLVRLVVLDTVTGEPLDPQPRLYGEPFVGYAQARRLSSWREYELQCADHLQRKAERRARIDAWQVPLQQLDAYLTAHGLPGVPEWTRRHHDGQTFTIDVVGPPARLLRALAAVPVIHLQAKVDRHALERVAGDCARED